MANTAAAGIAKELPDLLKRGLEIYKSLRDDMERALRLKQYADRLAELNSIMNGVIDYLNQEEKSIVEILVEANDLTQMGLQKSIAVISLIKSQCNLLLAVLQQDIPVEQQKERFYTACVYFGAFAKNIEAKTTEAENDVVSASNKLFEARSKIVTVESTLERVHKVLAKELEEAIAKQREKAYGGEIAGILFGPVGLIIAYAIADGIMEGKSVDLLKRNFKKQRENVASYIEKFNTMKDDTDSLKALLDKRKSTLIDIHSKLSSAGTIAGFDVTIIPLLAARFDTIHISIKNIRENCELLLQPLRKKIEKETTFY